MKSGIPLLLLLLCGLIPVQQSKFDGDPLPSGPKRAEFVTFVAPDPVNVTAGKPAVVPLRFRVAQGMHINSHLPHAKELIATQLAVAEEPGVNVVSVDFPDGSDYGFAFSPKEKLSVYEGEFVLHAHVIVRAGNHPVHALLRYQACDSASCYPPKTIPVSFEVTAK